AVFCSRVLRASPLPVSYTLSLHALFRSLIGFNQEAIWDQACFKLHLFTKFFDFQGINNAVVIGEGTPSGIGVIWPEHGGSLVRRSEEHTSNSSHVSISYAVFCLKKKTVR